MLTFLVVILLLTLAITVPNLYRMDAAYRASTPDYPQLNEMSYAPPVTVPAGWYRAQK